MYCRGRLSGLRGVPSGARGTPDNPPARDPFLCYLLDRRLRYVGFNLAIPSHQIFFDQPGLAARAFLSGLL